MKGLSAGIQVVSTIEKVHPMDFQTAIQSGFHRWLDFSSRSSRSEYWYFYLFIFLAAFVAVIFDTFLSAGILYALVMLVTLIPSIAVSVRRLHDVDKSGWWLLLYLIPVIGVIVLLIWFCSKGTTGPNRFGPDPL